MKSYYSNQQEEIKKKIEAEKIQAAGDFLWKNFCEDFSAKREGITRPFIEKLFRQMLVNHGASNIPNTLFGYMDDDDLFRSATELYVYIQLTAQGVQQEFWPTALEQSNPYVLRYHVLDLHNRMYDLIQVDPAQRDKKWEDARAKVYRESRQNLKHLETGLVKYPAFVHFLLGYTHFTLAMGATEEFQATHWKEAYKEFLLCEKTENIHPNASWLVNLGQGVFKDMPYANLEPVKSLLETHLDPNAIREVRLGLSSLKI
jgi:hypothetical protein